MFNQMYMIPLETKTVKIAHKLNKNKLIKI